MMLSDKRSTAKPVIRLREVCLENFKSINHGEFIINSDEVYAVREQCSDLVGIYGQNGSGKTAIIDALGILKRLLKGESLREDTIKYIPVGKDYATFMFTFEYVYDTPFDYSQTVTYSFKLREMVGAPSEEDKRMDTELFGKAHFAFYQTEIYDETVSVSGIVGNEVLKKQAIITTVNINDFPFGPVRKISEFVGSKKNTTREALKLASDHAKKYSQSFIFSKYSLMIFNRHRPDSNYVQILMDLQKYAESCFFVITKENTNALPIYTNTQNIIIKPYGATELDEKEKQVLDKTLSTINTILPQIVPGMEIVVKDARIYADDDRTLINLYSRRNGCDVLLEFESEGIQRIISILYLFTQAFNNNSTLIAIDEFDAGIYEYLLGDLLVAFEKYGSGQLIFTSHNLRPLEVLEKEHLLFTTTNPDNRYIRLKGVGKSNNLRDLYLREILNSNQDEELYSASKQFRLVLAFQQTHMNESMSQLTTLQEGLKATHAEILSQAEELKRLQQLVAQKKAGVRNGQTNS